MITVADATIGRLGVVKGARVLAFMLAWQTARAALADDWPADDGVTAQLHAYRDWWRQSERTSWRELARFREAFPDAESPSRILDLVQDVVDARRGVQGLGAAPLPARPPRTAARQPEAPRGVPARQRVGRRAAHASSRAS